MIIPGNGINRPAKARLPATRKTYVAYERLVTRPGGSPCVTTGYRVLPTGVDPGFGATADRDFNDILAEYQPCPAAARPQAGSPPSVLAESFWQEVPLPNPRPRIAPGWAITGKASYLETSGSTSHSFTRDTPFGPMRVVATGAYYVDWGDGTRTGPHAGEGRPWPDGRITHTYQDVGSYDVVVTERWTATWRVGGRTGQLTELRTVGRIESFRVEQIQAVVVG